MVRETGVVLKTQGNRCVVLTPRGEFRTVPRTGGTAAVGQVIEFARPTVRSNWSLWLAAASLFVILVAGTLFTSIFPAAGYVSVDINPSIELGMNAWGRVVTTKGLDSDGKNLLRSLPLYGRPLDQALGSIAQKAMALHFLKQGDPDNLMMVTYTPGRLIQLHQQKRAYQALVDRFQSDRTPVRLVFARMTRQEQTQARKLGLSAGKYLVRERLAAKGVNVTAKQMAQTSIAKLLRARKVRIEAIMGPGTIYRKVMMPPAKAPPTRHRSGMTTGPGVRAAPAMPFNRQGGRSMGTAAKTSRFSVRIKRLKEKVARPGFRSPGRSKRHSGSGKPAEKKGGLNLSGGPETQPGNAGQSYRDKMAPTGGEADMGSGSGSGRMP